MNYMIIQNLVIVIWILSLSLSIVWIKNSSLENLTKAVWVLIVLIVPILGSIAFIIVHRLGSGPPTDKSVP